MSERHYWHFLPSIFFRFAFAATLPLILFTLFRPLASINDYYTTYNLTLDLCSYFLLCPRRWIRRPWSFSLIRSRDDTADRLTTDWSIDSLIDWFIHSFVLKLQTTNIYLLTAIEKQQLTKEKAPRWVAFLLEYYWWRLFVPLRYWWFAFANSTASSTEILIVSTVRSCNERDIWIGWDCANIRTSHLFDIM